MEKFAKQLRQSLQFSQVNYTAAYNSITLTEICNHVFESSRVSVIRIEHGLHEKKNVLTQQKDKSLGKA